MYRNLQVTEVTVMGMKGYQIQGVWRMCSDSFWEDVAHGAVFRSRSRAEAFLRRIKASSMRDQYWGKPHDYMTSMADCNQSCVNVYSVI